MEKSEQDHAIKTPVIENENADVAQSTKRFGVTVDSSFSLPNCNLVLAKINFTYCNLSLRKISTVKDLQKQALCFLTLQCLMSTKRSHILKCMCDLLVDIRH